MRISRCIFILVLLTGAISCNHWQRNGIKAHLGIRRAMYEYGEELWEHTSGRQDEVDTAIYWITKAAEKGELDAIHSIGLIKDSKGGVEWLRKGAELGDIRCMVSLAEAYGWGHMGLPQDKALADYWITKAVAADNKRQADALNKRKGKN